MIACLAAQEHSLDLPMSLTQGIVAFVFCEDGHK